MPWSYCDKCDNELEEPRLKSFVWDLPRCPACDTVIDCDKDQIIISAIVSIQEEIENLTKTINTIKKVEGI